jgi:hypothetical protein
VDEHTGWEPGGDDRGVRRRPRVLLVVAAAAAAVVAVATLVGAWRGGDAAPGAGDRLRVGDEPTKVGGWAALEEETGASVLVADPAALRVVDVDAGTDAEVSIRPANVAGRRAVERVGGHVVVQAADGRTLALGPGVGAVRDLGASSGFLPAPPAGVWLLLEGDGGPGRIAQVDLGAGVLGRPVDVPAGQTPVAGQGGRVLLGGPAGLRWWDPVTGWTDDISGEQVLDVGQTTTVVCDADCRTVDILGRDGGRTGRARTAEPVVAAALSPDERRVALVTGGEVATGTLLMVDRDAEQLETLANGFASPTSSPGPTWGIAGSRLFLLTADGDLAVVDAATGSVGVTDVDLEDAAAFVAVTPRGE